MSPWDLQFTRRARRNLAMLDPVVARSVFASLNRLASLNDPTASCKALGGPLKGLWRLRVGDYRVVLDIDHGRLLLVAIDVGHRSTIY